MEFKDIPAVDNNFYDRMKVLREQISNVVSQDPNADNRTVEDTLDGILPKPVLDYFKDWFPQKPQLEEDLIETFLNLIVPRSMEPDRDEGQRYQYSIYSEGWCLHSSHKKKPNFINGPSVANSDLYTLDELVKNWQDIFTLDVHIDESQDLRRYLAPRHRHGDMQVSGLLVTTQHQLRIVDSKANYVPGTTISYARSKSGLRHAFKLAEWLTGIEADGSYRTDIDDYQAARSRFSNPLDMWIRTMQIIEDMSKTMPGDLKNIIRLQRYSNEEAEDIRTTLEANPEIGNFVAGRSDLYFDVERPTRGRKNDMRFGEILIPSNGNRVGYQIFEEDDYTRSEGVFEQRHDQYRIRKENELKGGFTPWHWSVLRRISPFIVDPDMYDAFMSVYEPRLNLSNLK